jgi:polar amino acid transport system ATP-binding protein
MATMETAQAGTVADGAMVRLEGVQKRFGQLEVLRGIDLEIDKGQVVCLLGPSGSGKSTLLRCINLLEPPNAGRIFLEGKEITGKDAEEGADFIRRRVGMVFQQFNLFQHKCAIDNVCLAQQKVLDRKPQEARAKAEELLTRVGLADKVGEYPDRLSGGQQQRVAIARSLINDPYIILADEATGNLDSVTSGEIMEMLHRLNEAGKTIIMVTHEDDIAEYAKRIIRMRDGVIVDDGPSPRMLEAQSKVVAAG